MGDLIGSAHDQAVRSYDEIERIKEEFCVMRRQPLSRVDIQDLEDDLLALKTAAGRVIDTLITIMEMQEPAS